MDAARLPHLKKMRQRLRRNLEHLAERRAGYGELGAPLELVNEEAAQRRALAQIEAAIAMLTPPAAPHALVSLEAADDDELGQLLGKAIQELREQNVVMRQQTYATTIALAQRIIQIENDVARQVTAIHVAVAQVHEGGTIMGTDMRALLEARIGEIAAQFEAAEAGRESWQEKETRERREHQARRITWQRGLTLAVIILCILVAYEVFT